MPHLAKGVTWLGGFILAALGGTFLRQLIKSSEKEDRELADEERGNNKNSDKGANA